jgi:hypothetical protein
MDLEQLRRFLLWCTIINYGVLIVWFLAFMLAHDFLFRLHGRWFRIPLERFDAVHYSGMAVYKIGILLLNLVPLIALCAVS